MNRPEEKPVSTAVRNAITEVLHERFGSDAIADVDIAHVEDDDGEALLRIDVHHRFSSGAVDTRLTYGLTQLVRERLWKLGETDDCWLRHRYDERQRVAS